MNNIVYAMGTAGKGATGMEGSGLAAFMPLILMFVIFYFLLIRPQQKKAKQHKEMLSNLKKGDYIITAGGLYGVITGLSDNTLNIEIAPKVRVKISRNSVSGVVGKKSQ